MAVLEMLAGFFNSAGVVTWLMLLLCISLAYWYTSRKQAVSRLPPGPLALPILGSLPFFKSTNIVETLRDFQQKYGNMFTVDLGMRRVVVLNSYSVIKEALIKNGTATSARQPDSLGMQYRIDKGISLTNGDKWTEQRRYTLHTLRDFGLGKNLMERFILGELENLLSIMEPQCGKPYRPRADIQLAAANIITSFAFGRTMERDNPSFVRLLKALVQQTTSTGSGGLLVLFPFLRHVPLLDLTNYKAIIKDTFNVIECFKEWIKEKKEEIRLNPDAECSDFLGSYLKEIEKRKDEKDTYFTDDQLEWVIFDLYSGGVETSSTTMTWAILYLILNPQIQEKVHQELDEVVGHSTRPVMMDKTKLPYCEAVLSEVLRIVDLVPMIPRSALDDFHLCGYDIPAGTSLLINFSSCHHDPEIFPDSQRFDPTRFLDDNGKFKKIDAFMPFSIGKRACVGESLARMETFLFFVTILQNFSFRVPDGQPRPGTQGKMGIVNLPPEFDVIMTKRY